LPINSASRAYFSIKHPMYLATALNPALGVLGINDSSVTSLTDPNYYTLYQDFEFGLVPQLNSSTSLLYLNLSYVDYFCLPMQLSTFSYPSNTPIINSASTPSGFPTSATMASILATTNAGLIAGAASTWGKLGLPYYTNPYTDMTPSTYLRILAAKNSIDLGTNPVQFQGGMVPGTFFPANYVQDTGTGPSTGVSFMQTAYNYYASTMPVHTFTFKIFPASLPESVYTMTGNPLVAGELDFTCVSGGGPNMTLNLNTLSTEQLLSGSVWPFSSNNAAYTNEMAKLISALFTIGQFPFPGTTSLGSPFVNNTSGFNTLTYFTNPLSYSNGPWFNLYDQVLHKQFISQGSVPNNPTLGLAYGYDFDDLLDMSGIINGVAIQDIYGNPPTDMPYVVVELGILSGAAIPNIYEDTYSYNNVVVGSAANGVGVSFSSYNGSTTVTTTASATVTTTIPVVSVTPNQPFQVTFAFNGVNYTYDINLLRQVVVPATQTSSYSAIDQYFQGGITFTVGGTQGSPTFTINFNSTPPPWAG
jgi:hypothetical protein